MDFMDSWGPGSGGIWRDVAGFCHGVWTLLLVCKIRSPDDHKDLWFLAWFSPIGANRRQQEQEEPLGANKRQ